MTHRFDQPDARRRYLADAAEERLVGLQPQRRGVVNEIFRPEPASAPTPEQATVSDIAGQLAERLAARDANGGGSGFPG